MGGNPESPLAEAMNRLWAKYLPQMEERVAILQQAAANLASGNLTAAERQQASAEAHKLAGVLGTFGMQEGTELAREAEGMYANTSEAGPADGARLSAIADRLQTMVASRR